MSLQEVGQLPQSNGVVMNRADGHVALFAQQPPDLPGCVVMVDMKGQARAVGWSLASGADAPLRLKHLVEIGDGDSVFVAESMLPKLPGIRALLGVIERPKADFAIDLEAIMSPLVFPKLFNGFCLSASGTVFHKESIPEVRRGFKDIPSYTGIIDGIWSANASGAARVTELS